MDLSGRIGLLLILGGLGFVYSVLVWLVAWLVLPSWSRRSVRLLWLAVLCSLVITAGSISAFESMAWYFRHDPAGFDGLQRTGESYDTYLSLTRVAFIVLYCFLVLIAGGFGYLAGRMQDARKGSTALASLLAVSLFLLLTIRIVDYENSCHVGESFVLGLHCG